MVTLAVERVLLGFSLAYPSLTQRLAVKIVCHHVGVGVVSAAHHQTGMLSVKVSYGSQHALRPVPVIITPAVCYIPRGIIINGGYGMPVAAVKYGQILRTAQNAALWGAEIGGGMANNRSDAVNRPVGGLHGHLGTAITVQVIDHKLSVVCSGADITPQVNAPHECSVHPVGVNINRPGIACV